MTTWAFDGSADRDLGDFDSGYLADLLDLYLTSPKAG